MPNVSPDSKLIEKIRATISSGEPVDSHLDTDERVLARITDGIYRQPASALRELIANAYDADAENVSIITDCPRFSAIKVSDDGIGMSPEALANLVLHIGGSAKRTQRGPEIGIASTADPTRSNGGRRLIGKIGIGLFSVAQLTRQFTIVTKTAGTNYQLLAHVTLNRFDEAELGKIDQPGHHSFRAGEVRIWSEKTPDKKGHGTTIQLTTLLPRVVHILQSRDMWAAIDEEIADKKKSVRQPPYFHIGRIDPIDPSKLLCDPQTPWHTTKSRDGKSRFADLVQGIATAWERSNHFARLEHALDNYFQLLWTLGLSLPLPYVSKNPLDLNGTDASHFFRLPERKGETKLDEISVGPRQTMKQRFDAPFTEDVASDFDVNVDGVRLLRPIQFSEYPKTAQALSQPVMFFGTATPDMKKIPDSQRGGDLSFSGYFFWVPRIIPIEHNGLLIRINGASGTLFDPTFLKYQVGERRLSQLMGEVFVHTGLDGALNIDRESFNTAHPHYQVLAIWVHNSLRLIRNTLKSLQSDALERRRSQQKKAEQRALVKTTNSLIEDLTEYDPEEIARVEIVDQEAELKTAVKEGAIGFRRDEIALPNISGNKQQWLENHAAAVARLLDAFGVLSKLDRTDQAKLVKALVALFIDDN